ncbi:MAG: hypothetical protein ABIH41_06395 [Nanoarchaeota archaeon]
MESRQPSDESGRVVVSPCYDCALEDIDHRFSHKFPVYIRGIGTSTRKGLVLPGFSEVGKDVPLSTIEHILDEGTELVLDQDGFPADRPMDYAEGGILTRVGTYDGDPRSFTMMFVRNAIRNLLRSAEEHLDIERRNEVIPALLVYDSSKVVRMKQVEIALPNDRIARCESLLALYVLKEST